MNNEYEIFPCPLENVDQRSPEANSALPRPSPTVSISFQAQAQKLKAHPPPHYGEMMNHKKSLPIHIHTTVDSVMQVLQQKLGGSSHPPPLLALSPEYFVGKHPYSTIHVDAFPSCPRAFVKLVQQLPSPQGSSSTMHQHGQPL